MKPGTQIAYVPLHAEGNLKHPDVEFGFVSKEHKSGTTHYCRYWRKGHLGELRTVANSELTPNDCLVEYKSVDQWTVVSIMRGLGLSMMNDSEVVEIQTNQPAIVPVMRVHRPNFCTHLFSSGVCIECGAIEGSEDAKRLAEGKAGDE